MITSFKSLPVTLQASLMMLLALFCFTTMGICIRLSSAFVPVIEIVFFRNILAGGIRPHYYCLPVAKRETHRQALVAAAMSGEPSFFLGTDSAPHLDSAKLAPCGCAGIYTSPNTLACLAQIFDQHDALDKLDGFVARQGAAFYGVPVNAGTVTLRRTEDPQPVPMDRVTPDGMLTVFDPMVPIHWEVVG